MTRVLHISDVHVEEGFSEVPWTRFLDKRGVGLANLLLRRRRHYADAPRVLAAMAEWALGAKVDVLLLTGDLSALGTRPELRAARRALTPLLETVPEVVILPGNHDVYLARDGAFEASFGDLLRTDLPELAVDGVWPQVRLFGEDLAVVAIESARPNPQIRRSSGRTPQRQLEALAAIFAHPALRGRLTLVATHYALRRPDGSPDSRHHGLENAEELLQACADLERGAFLHGHIHRRFFLQGPPLPLPLFGAGSSTHRGHEGGWVFDLADARAEVRELSCDAGAFSLSEVRATIP
ncbi:MAG: metallophosphoesterase [Deltaproteobacteria bacterium]|nr:metallophosphoesterase [Deltaproteobacteria bacterium]